MENIYFQPNKENSEFLAKLEKLDEYTIPQILERMVEHFRNLPELEDALNKLGIKTDSLEEEELDDDIRVEERFYVGGKPKKLRHFKGDNPTPLLEKEWYQNGQLKRESYSYDIESKAKQGELSKESKNYYENVQKFVGIKVIGANALTFSVTGDGIQNTDGTKTASIILQAGDIIWGSFMTVDRTSGTGGYLLYKG